MAQIYGKPVFVITDVALLPLTSQTDADKAITAATASRGSTESTAGSDSELSDGGDEDDSLPSDAEPEGPVTSKPGLQRSSSVTSIAKDVWVNRGQYGRFASQWFSGRGWGLSRNATQPPVASNADTTSEGDAAAAANLHEPPSDTPDNEQIKSAEQITGGGSIRDALPKILRTTKMILTSGSFFFSYDFDLTRRLALMTGATKGPSQDTLDPLVR